MFWVYSAPLLVLAQPAKANDATKTIAPIPLARWAVLFRTILTTPYCLINGLNIVRSPNVDKPPKDGHCVPVLERWGMFELFDLRAFARIAELGSISGAARALTAPKSSISRSLTRLETELGSALVERSTRHVRLTDAGRLFQPYALRILSDVDEAEAVLGSFAGVPQGTLRVRAPYTFALGVLAPMLPSFLDSYPEVDVVLQMEDGRMDLLDGEADLIVKVGPLPETTMVARRLATVELWTCASPHYLAAHGSPSSVADLAAHAIVSGLAAEASWSFRDAQGRRETVEVHPRAVVPDAALSCAVLAGGAGIGQLPDYMAADAIENGQLIRILPHMLPATADAHVLYPSRRSVSSKLRVFIDALVVRTATQRVAFAETRG